MGEKLDFSLPEKKPRGSAAGVLMVLLLLVVAALTAVNLFVALSPGTVVSEPRVAGLSAEQVKALANKLAQRNLHVQAADAWRDYLAGAELTDAERARALFQIGMALEKAGRYGEAIDSYYRSELTAQDADLAAQIKTHVSDCFERLGNFAALRYERMDRTSLDGSEPAGGKVVAEIGPEKVTEAALDAAIERQIENQLAPMEAFMAPEQVNEQKKRLLERYRDVQARQEFLQTWLAQEILYRQALDEGLAQKPATKQMLEDVTRGVLSQQLMNEKLAARINLTETDVRTFYEANKGKYMDLTRAKIRHIRVSEEQQAVDLLKRIKDGDDFAELAGEFSLDEATKNEGGLIAADVVEGAYVAGVGDANEINAAVFTAEPPAVLDKPFQTDSGWEIIKVEQKHAARQKGFDEVREQVMQELLSRKRQEVQSDYLKEMMDKHGVIVHSSVFAPPQAGSEVPSS